jgi:hypothetical protein
MVQMRHFVLLGMYILYKSYKTQREDKHLICCFN